MVYVNMCIPSPDTANLTYANYVYGCLNQNSHNNRVCLNWHWPPCLRTKNAKFVKSIVVM